MSKFGVSQVQWLRCPHPSPLRMNTGGEGDQSCADAEQRPLAGGSFQIRAALLRLSAYGTGQGKGSFSAHVLFTHFVPMLIVTPRSKFLA